MATEPHATPKPVSGATTETEAARLSKKESALPATKYFFQPFGASVDIEQMARVAQEKTAADIFGGKGLGLLKMSAEQIPVPMGFILPTTWANSVRKGRWGLKDSELVDGALRDLEKRTASSFNDRKRLLLVSVRSGAAVSMPGMMDTILNIGLTETSKKAIDTKNPGFGTDLSNRLNVQYEQVAGAELPSDPYEQLTSAIRAVIASADNPRVVAFRKEQGLDQQLPTAVIVQAMAFGNRDDKSGTGVAFTRSPIDGKPGLYGDFLVKAQGDDVVGGTQQTELLKDLKNRWPDLYQELTSIAEKLEHIYQDMVDIEFTIDNGKLWILQARVGMRSPQATLRIAVDLANDKRFTVSRADAIERCRDILKAVETHELVVNPETQLAQPRVLGNGLAASPGVGRGILTTSLEEAIELSNVGEDVVLARNETTPNDIVGMAAARAIVTTTGGLVSHAAIVAREWKLPAVVGVTDWQIRDDGVISESSGEEILNGTPVTVDGSTGTIYKGLIKSKPSSFVSLSILRGWQTAQFDQTDVAESDTDFAVGTKLGTQNSGKDAERGNESAVTRSPTAAKAQISGSHKDPVMNLIEPDELDIQTSADYELSSFEFGILRTLGLKGFAEKDTLDYVLCENPLSKRPVDKADQPVLETAIAKLQNEGLVETNGEFLHLSTEGKSVLDDRFALESEFAYRRIVPALKQFVALDNEFKELMTLWQTRQVDGVQVLNDHRDLEYDRTVLKRIRGEIHPPILEVIAVASSALEHFDRYRYRLSRALIQAETGNPEMIASPLADSYHSVWFELHEELLRLVDQPRCN